MNAPSELVEIRRWLAFFIVALILSGVTAFPLSTELRLLGEWFHVDAANIPDHGLQWWLRTVRDGLADTYSRHPWLAYGTDWLAFAHIVIAVFFVGPYRDPVRNVWIIQTGLIACAGVLVLAFTCGPIRGIPFYWQLIDSSFGIFGALPLWRVLFLTRKLEKLAH
jgi:hypothetical protein